ncbi:MAG: malate synthase A [Chloroflexi bacterium]|nr:malate synthase A [Chloroflexota bacterium]
MPWCLCRRAPDQETGEETVTSGVEVLGRVTPEFAEVLSTEALTFVADLSREFEGTRRALIRARAARQAEIDAGQSPDFLTETQAIRQRDWKVAPPPSDLLDRRVELTGPSSDRKMVSNALNSGAQVYMTDFEDAHSPGWSSTLQGQINIRDAARRTISFRENGGREYRLGERLATLVVRPRGFHLLERHVLVDGQPVAGSFFDFGLTFFHSATALLERGSGPYFYLPKMQSHLEARLWRDVFAFSEDRLGLTRGTIRATVLIEHILAAFEMEEVLYELRQYITALNLGRWDYIFSVIKTFAGRRDFILPDRSQVTMTTQFLRSAAELLAHLCHKRGAHALGGMSTYIPRRDDQEANEKALAQVRADKEREAQQGHDGAWVAHPALVPVVQEVFQRAFQGPNQLNYVSEVRVSAKDLLAFPTGAVTEAGVRNNISVALQYVDAWVRGSGAVAIFGLMEDTATAEISRSQLWQWLWHGAVLADGRPVTQRLYQELRADEVTKLLQARGAGGADQFDKAVELLDGLVTNPAYTEFLTVPGNRYLE